jgi:hypothetical protein
MRGLLLVAVVIFALAGIIQCAKTNDRPRGAERELTTLADSIHEYEDGF